MFVVFSILGEKMTESDWGRSRGCYISNGLRALFRMYHVSFTEGA